MNDIVFTKWVGLGETARLAREQETILKERLPLSFIKRAAGLSEQLEKNEDGRIAKIRGADLIIPPGDKGIFGDLWLLAQERDCGLDIFLKDIPVRQETIEICEIFSKNPYILPSEGALLISIRDGHGLVYDLKKKNINAAVIGKETASKDRVIINGEDRRFLVPPERETYFE